MRWAGGPPRGQARHVRAFGPRAGRAPPSNGAGGARRWEE
eukprot:gene27452-24046_t